LKTEKLFHLIRCLVKAIMYLHLEQDLVHGNLTLKKVAINENGDYKLILD